MQAAERDISNDLDRRFGDNLAAKVEHLTKHLAATQFALRFEVIGKLIWGTQLELLLHVNARGKDGAPISDLRVFYDTSAAQAPDGLRDYPFERYLGFLKDWQLLLEADGRVFISIGAQEFLAHLARTGATYRRAL